MLQKNINLSECDDLQITSHLNMEALPQFLQDLLSVAHTTEQKDMLLTGTFSQFKALVPSVENGFFSRLMTVVVREHQDFDGSVFQPSNEGAEVEALIGRLAMQVKRLNDELNREHSSLNDAPKGLMMNCGEIEFRLTAEQARLLGQVMEKEYKEYVRVLGDGFHASVVRNGINVMRIALILSVLRHCSDISETIVDDIAESVNEPIVNDIAETPENPDRFAIPEEARKIVCSEEDFQTAMVIGTKMLLHAADAYNQIAEGNKEAVPSIKGSYQKETFFVSLPEEFSTGECTQHCARLGVNERTIRRWMDSWIESGLLIKTDYGHFQKVA